MGLGTVVRRVFHEGRLRGVHVEQPKSLLNLYSVILAPSPAEAGDGAVFGV